MLNGKTVSIDFIIETLIRDYDFKNINKGEVAEWIWTSMSIIGTPYPYEDKQTTLTISEYRSALPLDLYSISFVREESTGIALREMSDVMNTFADQEYEGVTEVETDVDPSDGTTYYSIIGPDSSSEFYTYKVQGNYIYFGIDEGSVEMQYKAIPIDIVTGMPTIPDNARYIRGVVSYIAERMALRLMLKDLLSERKYEIIRQDYLFNVGAAKAECVLPDAARMETLINRWKSTYLGPDHFDTGFKYLGSRE